MSSIPYSRYLVYPVTWYSFLIVLGAALAILLASREERRTELKKDTIIDLSLWLLPFGIIGARIYYVVFAWSEFRDDPVSVFRIWEGGIAIYGAIIAGIIVLLIFCRIRKIPPLLLCDCIAPGLALAQSIGRWGNYFNMEAYGARITNPALCFFPLAVEISGPAGNEWHMATFFYESVLDFGIFLFLIASRRKLLKRRGDVFFFYLFLYAAGRLIVEDLRMDSLYASSNIRISQMLSILLCLAIMIRYLYTYYRQKLIPKGSFVLLSCISVLLSAFILLFSVTTLFPFGTALPTRILILAGYSLSMSLMFFLTYIHAKKADEKNAYNEGQKLPL